MRKKIIGLTITMLLVLSLVMTGCSSQSTNPSGNSSGESQESSYPEKPITLIVPYGPGGPVDLMSRTIGKFTEPIIGQSFVVQNVDGAGGEKGFSQMLRSNPDGYTISAMTSGHITLTVMRDASYDVVNDVQPICMTVKDDTYLVVRADDDRFNTIEDLINYAKANPKSFTVGTSGAGSSEHFAILGLNKYGEIEVKPVHFGGSAEAKAAFLGGHVDAFAPSFGEASQLVSENKAKIIGVFAEERVEAFPDVPTFKEKGINMVLSNIRGYAAPKGTPQEVIDKLAASIKKATEDPAYEEEMKKLGLPAQYADGAEYARQIKLQYDTYKELASEVAQN